MNTTIKHQSENSQGADYVGQGKAYTGNYFKFPEITFIEGKYYKLSDLIKEEHDGIDMNLDLLFYSCGTILNIGYKDYVGPMEAYDKFGKTTFEQISFNLKNNVSIIFKEGSADICNKMIPEGRSIVLGEGVNVDKLTFTIKKKDKDEIDGQMVKVSKPMFNKMKADCSKIDMKSLITVKNLMLSSAVVSGIGTAAGIAGTTMGALSIVNNKKDGKEDLNKKLDIGQTVTSAIGTATSATSLTTSAISADKIKKLIQDIEDCKNSTSLLGVVID